MKTVICCSCFILCVFVIHQRGRPISKAKNPSVIINRNRWKAATVNHASDYQQNLSDEQVRKYLSMLKNQDRKGPLLKDDTVVSHVLEVLNPVEVKQNFLTKQLTTTTEQQTTTTEQLTTEEATTEQLTTEEATTENPNNLPKSGEVELLVENIVYSGHMIHWSAREQYLAISDIWGQKYLRFEEIPPATTTTAPDTTTATTEPSDDTTTASVRNVDDITTTTDTIDTVTTTEIQTTTEEVLPYDIKILEVD